MKALLPIAIMALLFAACSDDDRPTRNDAPATASQESDSFANALEYFRTSSPPVVDSTVVYSDPVECDGIRCCDPHCPAIDGNTGRACNDPETNTGYVALDFGDCADTPMRIKLDAVKCASVRCQTTGCGRPFDEFFADCVRE